MGYDPNAAKAPKVGGGLDGDGGYNQDQIDQAAANVNANVANGAPGLGSIATDPARYDLLYGSPSGMRGDQSSAERIQDQETNFLYGGTPTGAADAIAAGQANMAPYTSGLYGNASAYGAAGAGADGRQAYGTQQYLGADAVGQAGMYGAAGQLSNLAMQGPGPSIAQANLAANTGAAMRQQLAMAGSGRGAGGGASAFRQAGMNQATIQGQANAQAAMLGAQETADYRNFQAAALGQAGGLYGAGRQGDMAALASQQAQMGMNDQYALGMGGLSNEALSQGGNMQLGTDQLGNQINMGALQGSMGYEDNLSSIYGINKGVSAAANTADKAAAAQNQAAVLAALGTAAAVASDERVKTNVESAPDAGIEMLSSLTGNLYDYTEPDKHGHGRHYGPMAQELEKTEAGRGSVIERNGVKMVDSGRLTLALAGAVASKHRKDESSFAELQKRLAKLEGKRS
jgi:hypothetical protein